MDPKNVNDRYLG